MSRVERNKLFPTSKIAEDLNIRRLHKAIHLLELALKSGHIIDSHFHYPRHTPTDLIRVSIANISINYEETAEELAEELLRTRLD